MKRALWVLSAALIVTLSACGSPAAPTTAAPPAPPTAPATVAPTAAPTTAPASPTTAAAEPTTAPTASGPCTDKASFVDDVTVPDYSHFDQKAGFTKTWRVKNIGTCTWTSDYQAKYAHGDAFGGATPVPLSTTVPGATIDISVNMVAPSRDGKFETFYQLVNAAGDPIPVDDGATIWALITVGKFVAYPLPTATTASTGSSGAGLATVSCVSQGNTDFITQTVSLINAARAAQSLPALTVNDKLTLAAQSHSADMACNNFLNHIGWNGSTPESRIAAAGYAASITRENIYAQPPQYGGNPQAAMDFWKQDTTHWDNAILNPQVTEIGVGYAAYSRSDLGGYFTVDLAAP